ncbi:substrate-binding domain-containing protein [Candidatus Darwinibacter acetoxidans]|jgi:ribose transport system substrate-binding protein|nr:ABC transporter substrate-binding protein [Bacillota bacterium]HBG09873.1 LacI family transcriptional regulator [Bacillota bacterium]
MRRIAAVLLVAVLVMAMAVMPAAAQEKKYDIAVIVKATDSDFWQYVLIGALNAAVDYPVNVTTYGPPSEVDIEQQIAILENVITRQPDAIVIASTSSEASVPALERAYDQGIVIITIDNAVRTDKIHSFLATDNIEAGGKAAEIMVEFLKERGLPLNKKVGVISSMAGVQVLIDRDNGFVNRLRELAPEMEILPIRYVDDDMLRAMQATEDLLTAHGDDIVGFFADNNLTGDGLARVIDERGLHDKIVAVAFDSDPEEIQALRTGALDALILQDPYNMGYMGVVSAIRAIEGEELPKYVDTGSTVATKANMDEPEIVELLDPTLKKKY